MGQFCKLYILHAITFHISAMNAEKLEDFSCTSYKIRRILDILLSRLQHNIRSGEGFHMFRYGHSDKFWRLDMRRTAKVLNALHAPPLLQLALQGSISHVYKPYRLDPNSSWCSSCKRGRLLSSIYFYYVAILRSLQHCLFESICWI